MAKLKTQEQFEKELKEKFPQIQVRGKYQGSNKRVNVHCNIDDYDWEALPTNLCTYGCPVCNGGIVTTQSFRNEILKLYPDIEVLGEWNGIKNPIECHCKKCDLTWTHRPRTIREKGCPRCNGSVTRKWTDEEYKEELYKIHGGNIISLEPYKNMNTKILHRCYKHNYEYYAKPAHVVGRKQGCKYCAHEKISKAELDTIENVKLKIFNKWGNEIELLDDEYHGSNKKALFKHNMKNGLSHTFYSTVNAVIQGQGCGVCTGQQICIGYNDIATTNPYVASLFENDEETHLYTEWSGKSVNFRCPNCGNIRKKVISQVSRDNDICCPICGDGYSYPNKFIYNCLLQIQDSFDFLKREYTPDWCKFDFHGKEKTGKYDIYFSINGISYFCEMDGGLGHGNRELRLTKEDSLFIDSEKDRLAFENNINMIRIDCDYGRDDKYEFIKQKIFESELSNIIDLSLIDFDKANIEAQSSLLVTACQLWNEGYNAQEIANTINVVGSTVTNYLKNGSKYGLCKNYSSKESMYRSHGRDVICINTKKKFRSIVDGANYYGLLASDISKCCRRKSTYGGIYNGEKMIWMYFDEYEKLSDYEKSNYKPKENDVYTKVVCLNTHVLFNIMNDAKEWCNMKSTTGIVNCCTGKYKTSGKHPETGESLRWMYYKDYIEKFDESTLLLYGRLSA